MSLTIDEINSIEQNADCLFDEAAVDVALDKMAGEITEKLKDEQPIILCVMTGGLMFTADVLSRMNFPLELDYLHATRYRGETVGGAIHWLAEPKMDLEGRTVLIMDDILDGGVTLCEIVQYCKAHNAKAVYTAVFINKLRERDKKGLKEADFVGIDAEDRFLFGYGMDYKGYLRNLRGIYAVKGM